MNREYRKAGCALLILILGALQLAMSDGLAQKRRRQTTSRPTASSVRPPCIPDEVRVGWHRDSERALFVTLKNEDSQRGIKKIVCSILVNDTIKLKIVKAFPSVVFEFAVPIPPGQSFAAVLTKGEVSGLDGEDFVPGRCKGYEHSKDEEAEKANVFVPGACTQDAFVLVLDEVIFVDNSKWLSSSRERLENAIKQVAKTKPPDREIKGSLSRVRITSAEFGDSWPFTVSEGVLACGDISAVLFTALGKTYALNGASAGRTLNGVPVSMEVAEIQDDDLQKRTKKTLSPVIDRGLRLCKD